MTSSSEVPSYFATKIMFGKIMFGLRRSSRQAMTDLRPCGISPERTTPARWVVFLS